MSERDQQGNDKEHDPLRAALEYIASGKWGDHESASGIALRALEETPSSAGIACIDERTAMLLAAISTASIQNTRESAKERVGRDNPYCTQAYLDVCAAVDREMAQRERAERAEADLGTQSASRTITFDAERYYKEYRNGAYGEGWQRDETTSHEHVDSLEATVHAALNLYGPAVLIVLPDRHSVPK